MATRSRRYHSNPIPKYVFKIRDLYYFCYVWPRDITESLNKKELRLALKTRDISEAAKIASKLSQWYVYRYTQFYNKLLPHFF